MPIIRVLSPSTIDKIAAGEVLERPANAVKELVENALDAGARKVTVQLEDGGRELIRVVDNGVGMRAEDARLSILPHATSKLAAADDLFRVATFGFRGEALSSMAAVADLEIETRHESEDVGLLLRVSGGELLEERPAMRPPGTTVTVKRLFYHSPVRRKFMGTARSEGLKIVNMVTRLSFAHPAASFRIGEEGREVLFLTEGTLKHRAGEILGFNITQDLLPLEWSDGHLHLEGFISTAQQARGRSNSQFLYVNRRAVHSPLLGRAWAQAYDALPPGKHPFGVIFITMPLEEVDVNVHPSKREVRFLNENRVFWSVSQAVKRALLQEGNSPLLDLGLPVPPPSEGQEAGLRPLPFSFHPAAPPASFSSSPSSSPSSSSPLSGPSPSPSPFTASVLPFKTAMPGSALPEGKDLFALPAAPGSEAGLSEPAPSRPRDWAEEEKVARASAWQKPGEGFFTGGQGAVPYLQLHYSFILFEVGSGLMLVNQQAAHERVLFEKALQDLSRPERHSSQQILFPELLECSPEEQILLERNLHQFQALGFDLEPFGGRAFQVRGLPSDLTPEKGRQALFDMLADLEKPDRSTPSFAERLARAYARVAAIRMGEPLDYARIAALVDALFATRNPYVSPAGAPIVTRISMDELRRKFELPPLAP